jgi:hypothetical protein
VTQTATVTARDDGLRRGREGRRCGRLAASEEEATIPSRRHGRGCSSVAIAALVAGGIVWYRRHLAAATADGAHWR